MPHDREEKRDLREESRRAKEERDTEKPLSEKMEEALDSAFSGEKSPEGRYLDTYTVKSGDNLSSIARHYYGTAERDAVMAIYEENKEVIGNDPNLIFPGQEFKIPRLEEND